MLAEKKSAYHSKRARGVPIVVGVGTSSYEKFPTHACTRFLLRGGEVCSSMTPQNIYGRSAKREQGKIRVGKKCGNISLAEVRDSAVVSLLIYLISCIRINAELEIFYVVCIAA